MQKKIGKYCFFTNVANDNNEVVIYRQAKCLREYGYETTYVVTDDSPSEIIDGTHVISSGFKTGGYFKRIFILPWRMYKKLKQINADVYQTACVELLIVCLLLKIKGKKVLYHLRESHPYTFYNKSKLPYFIKRVLVSFMIFWMKFCLRHVDVVITVSDDILSYLKRWKIANCFLLGNFPYVNPSHFVSYDEYLNRENRILYFGSIYEISRQECFLDALSKVDSVKYLLAGKFFSIDYQNKLKENPNWHYVEFIDGFSLNELDDFFKRSTISNVLRDFSATKTRNGSMGVIKIFESMEACLPIICSDVPVYKKMMEEY